MGNPVLPGYYADPSVLQFGGKVYVYATIDPWGQRILGCWESADFKHWTFRSLNWPTKEACTSPTSKADSMVWAPSVVRMPGGRFFMYVSCGSEVWVGSAASPLGPWADANGGKPLVGRDFDRTYHMIDQEAFVDDDGSVYLYWGSGWNWVNGRCFAVKLKPDFVSFDGPVHIVTPANGHYFEAPFMANRFGKYFLMYSGGKTISDTYCVHYAVGATPFGPFTEGSNSPILATDRTRDVISPGHHAVFRFAGHDYIAYHRHRLPFVDGTAFRQVCMDNIVFHPDGRIENVSPTHLGAEIVRGRAEPENMASAEAGASASSSSQLDALHGPERVLDDNYATRWEPAAANRGSWLQLDLGTPKTLQSNAIRFEYAWKPYLVALEVSIDGKAWRILEDHRADGGVSGSPVVFDTPVTARFERLIFADSPTGEAPSVFEWQVF
jgi:beta-xylosidase